MPSLYDVPAPAKLNLFLHVVGRRADGYHLLQTVFRFIDLADAFDFERVEGGGLSREGDVPPGLPASEDLVLRAARALQQAAGVSYGARIRYRKRIPVGGGLGGGSSDAATALIALNRLWGAGLDRAALMRLAEPLGADVPVFVFGQPAFAQGIGEDLTAVALPDRAYLVVRPPVQVSTAEIFSAEDLTRNTPSVKISVFADWQSRHWGLYGRNDLEAVVLRRHPRISRVLRTLRDVGLDARMTGSGSCVFAPLDDLAQARMHQDRIISKIASFGDGSIEQSWACTGLHDHPLRHWING
ncbi:4-(cytidine 5'-diphospho)-2-C-methyl-D-erythritol kinase [Castellaniella sp. GW247-6E4]|uniref:4-(cytidine 5'-diphospho)-2-C-methyl-D-erythritol kinase n=1 Tax=Castellaniella sp. GW247-6E4 TaxID=3140380 RepID=UPI0033157EAB